MIPWLLFSILMLLIFFLTIVFSILNKICTQYMRFKKYIIIGERENFPNFLTLLMLSYLLIITADALVPF